MPRLAIFVLCFLASIHHIGNWVDRRQSSLLNTCWLALSACPLHCTLYLLLCDCQEVHFVTGLFSQPQAGIIFLWRPTFCQSWSRLRLHLTIETGLTAPSTLPEAASRLQVLGAELHPVLNRRVVHPHLHALVQRRRSLTLNKFQVLLYPIPIIVLPVSIHQALNQTSRWFHPHRLSKTAVSPRQVPIQI